MDVTFTPLDPAGADRDALVALLTENAWPFHTRPRVTRPEAEKAVDGGAWEDEDHRTFWIEHPEHGRVGVVRLEDLTDPTPLFDLRVAERFRGRGLGAQILTALTRHVFETMPAVDRFEGQTREDNVPMLRTFRRAGWVKEAHYRRGWPVDGGEPLASVAYAMLRQDWASGTTTPVPADVDAPPPAGRKEGAAAGGRAPDWPLPTARLTLRPHREDDRGWLQEMYTQPEVVHHLLDEPWDEATARAKLAKRITWDDLGGPSGAASLVVEHAGVPVGDVILWLTDRERGVAEIGWALDPRHAGQGFAREAAAALLDLGFETSGLHRVVAQMDARNTASARLAEMLGMRREAHHRQDLWSKGEWTDTLVYAMLASDRGVRGHL
ncbi:GNAT family N-acetyltransferase [Micrococcus luteus]|uniref:GNAT family N-acetyltransferase n=1 Tax=Micrococcus luteus TaxID=1270 RepID=UPI001C2400CE|nr:GNAT family N-acetyltransferase [Micrococcus luteus]